MFKNGEETNSYAEVQLENKLYELYIIICEHRKTNSLSCINLLQILTNYIVY